MKRFKTQEVMKHKLLQRKDLKYLTNICTLVTKSFKKCRQKRG